MNKIILMILVLGLNGCAYMMSGETQSIDLRTSDSKNVKVKVKNDGKEAVYTIPSKITVKKSQDNLIVTTIKTDCITPTTTIISSKMDEWAYGNISTLGLGFLKDMEGSMWKYDDAYTIDVKRDNACMKKAKELNDEIFNMHM